MELVIADVMTRFPTTVRLGSRQRHAAELVAASEIGQLMVLDDADRFVGVLAEGDLLRALLPGADELRVAGATVAAGFAAFRVKAAASADAPIDPLVVRDPVTVTPDADIAAAAVVMGDRGLRRLPVVSDGALVGTVSRIDLCRAVLARAAAAGPPRRHPDTAARAPTPTPTSGPVPAATPAPSAGSTGTAATPAAALAAERLAEARRRLGLRSAGNGTGGV